MEQIGLEIGIGKMIIKQIKINHYYLTRFEILSLSPATDIGPEAV